ncbi:MAG: hypothetical protein Q4D41_02455 [Prevotellaceae bacterium]|nr:hypothetical protein [Prevotellaceae bacterium]
MSDSVTLRLRSKHNCGYDLQTSGRDVSIVYVSDMCVLFPQVFDQTVKEVRHPSGTVICIYSFCPTVTLSLTVGYRGLPPSGTQVA